MPVTQLDAPDAAAEAGTPVPTEEAPKRRRRRLGRRGVIVLVAALVLLLGGAGYGVWALFFADKGAADTQYRTVTVAQQTLKSTVSATGTLQPAKESALSFSSSGEVSSVKVAVGDKVSKGDVLARINDDELQIDLDAAKAELTEAEDSLSTLTDDSSATDTAIAAAQASVQVKKNAVKQAQSALDNAELVAPFSGTVAAVGIEKGDTVGSTSGSSGSNSSTSSSASITLISTGTFVVDTSVSNVDLPSIKKGLQATITPTGSTDPVFGTVSTVGVVASSSSTGSGSGSGSGSNSGSATFPVEIAVTGKHTDLLPGSSATVEITVKQLANVISVPTQAISSVDGKTVVQKLVDGQQVQTEVSIGQVVGSSTVITKGLADGDQVVVASFTTTAAGPRSNSGNNQNQGFPGGSGQGGFPGGQGGGQGGPPQGGQGAGQGSRGNG